MANPVVTVDRVSKVYPVSPKWLRLLIRSSDQKAVRALSEVSFEVEAGEILSVVGPNGAGKSTLFRVLTGLTTPTSGTATVLGVDVASAPIQIRRELGFMPSEDRTLWMRHSCFENLWFHGRLQGMSGPRLEKRIKQTLETVGLAHARNRVAFALSAGMNARLRLARALLHRPKLMILDEPTGTLDPVGAHEMVQTIAAVARETGTAVLMSSHRMEDVEELDQRVLLIGQGEVVYWGGLQALRGLWERPRLDMLFASEADALSAAASLGALEEVTVLVTEPPRVCVSTPRRVGDLLNSIDGSTLIEMQRTQMPLRELLGELLAAKKTGTPA